MLIESIKSIKLVKYLILFSHKWFILVNQEAAKIIRQIIH